MDQCIFCKIAKGEIPNYTVYEDDYVLAFLDIHPCAKGHTIVISKLHVASVKEMNAEEWGNVLEGVRRAANRVDDVLKPDGTNIGINDRPAAGQSVSHLHWHIIPRWTGDGGGSMHSIVRTEGDVTEIAKLF